MEAGRNSKEERGALVKITSAKLDKM